MTESVSTKPLIHTSMRGQVLLAAIDMPNRSMNVFSWALMDALEALINRIESDPAIGAVVVTSGKPSFLAGADLEMVRGFSEMATRLSPAELHPITGRLGRLFVRFEALTKPTVAAVNGLALGGGLELAMACSWRLVADDPRLQLGLPEIKLGLLPGGGGTQRMPRLIGAEKGLELLLNGKSLAPTEAKALGLVDDVVPAAELVERAMTLAAGLAGKPAERRMPEHIDPGALDFSGADAASRLLLRYGYGEDVTSRYPAYRAIVRSVIEGAGMDISAGVDNEMSRFIELMYHPAAGNMIATLFLNRQRAEKILPSLPSAKGIRFAIDGEGEAADGLRALLAGAKAELVAAGPADIVVGTSASHRVTDLTLMTDPSPLPPDAVGLFMRRSNSHGAAIEIVGPEDSPALPKALAIARLLWATPYVHEGSRSLLAALAAFDARTDIAGVPEDAILVAKAAIAAEMDAEGDVGDLAIADVACVVSGLFPAYAGGPFTFLRQMSLGALTRTGNEFPALLA